MGFRLNRQEPVGAGIARILNEELHVAMSSLREPETGIHEARKSIKKLRAVMRLLEPRLGCLARAENAILGEAGRALSAARDGEAVVEILDILATGQKSQAVLRSLAALRRRFGTGPTEPVDVAPVRRTLAEVGARVSEWPLLPESFGGLGDGLRETYRQGRRALAEVAESPTSETFHALRKRVKDHWYQVRLMEGVWAEAEPRELELRELQEYLGQDHDLTLLEERTNLVPTLQAVVAQARREYRAQAVAMAAVLYAEKSRDHVDRVHDLWSEWRDVRHAERKGPSSANGRRRRQVA